MNVMSWFMPKKRDFYGMLTAQTEKTVEGIRALVAFFENPNLENSESVVRLEQEADDLQYSLVAELNESFVTPIDREDIFRLSRAIDDMIDYSKKTVREIGIYKIVPPERMKVIGEALLKGSEEILWAVKHLDKDMRISCKHAKAAKKVENHIEYLYHEALAELFESKDTVYIMKHREIYRHLSNTADRCDDAADIINDITVKMS